MLIQQICYLGNWKNKVEEIWMIKKLSIYATSALLLCLIFNTQTIASQVKSGIYAEIEEFSDELPKMTPVFKMTPLPDKEWQESFEQYEKEYAIQKRVKYFLQKNGFLTTDITLNSDDKFGYMFIKMDKKEIISANALQICFSDKEDEFFFKKLEAYINIMVFNVYHVAVPEEEEMQEKVYNFNCNEMSWKFIKGRMFHNTVLADKKIGAPFSKEEQELYYLYDKKEFRDEIKRIFLHVNSKGDYSFYIIHDDDEELKRGAFFFESLNKEYLENIDTKSKCCIF